MIPLAVDVMQPGAGATGEGFAAGCAKAYLECKLQQTTVQEPRLTQ